MRGRRRWTWPLTSVTAPTTATVGQAITVNWQVTNQSSQAADRAAGRTASISRPRRRSPQFDPARHGACIPAAWAAGASYNGQPDRGRAGAGTGLLLRPGAGRQPLPGAPTRTGPTTRWPPDRAARRQPARPDAGHAPPPTRSPPPIRTSITRSPCRPAARWSSRCQRRVLGRHGAVCQPGNAADAVQLPGAADVANQPNQTVTVPQVLTRGPTTSWSTASPAPRPRPATRSPPRRRAPLTRLRPSRRLRRQRRQRHRRDRRHQLHADDHRQPDPGRHHHQRRRRSTSSTPARSSPPST